MDLRVLGPGCDASCRALHIHGCACATLQGLGEPDALRTLLTFRRTCYGAEHSTCALYLGNRWRLGFHICPMKSKRMSAKACSDGEANSIAFAAGACLSVLIVTLTCACIGWDSTLSKSNQCTYGGYSWRCLGAHLTMSSTRRIISAASVADSSTCCFTCGATIAISCPCSTIHQHCTLSLDLQQPAYPVVCLHTCMQRPAQFWTTGSGKAFSANAYCAPF